MYQSAFILGIGLIATAAFASPPNIILLVADDMRWDAMGCAGNGEIQTPHLDRLAGSGTRFTNAFATTAICCTSRVSILTGLYASTHGIDDFATPMPGGLLEDTYPARLRDAGYYTGFVGKWGIGGDMPADAFDVFNGFSGQGLYFNKVDGETVHMTQLLSRQARAFLDDAPEDRPFCLSLSFKAPHVQDNDPRQFLFDPAFEHVYSDRDISTPETATQPDYDAQPPFVRISENRNRWERRFANPEMFQASLKGYYRLVTGIDFAVGQLLETLEATGRAEDTVIIFTSDHGFFLGEYGLAGKWLLHEPSIRIPLLIYDPRIPERNRVPVRDDMALLIDIAPTVLAIAGAAPSPIYQGRNLLPLLRPGSPTWRDRFFYEHHYGSDRPDFIPAVEGIRNERWKYTRYVGQSPPVELLHDLIADPLERINLADQQPAQLAALRIQWRAWKDAFSQWDEPAARLWTETD